MGIILTVVCVRGKEDSEKIGENTTRKLCPVVKAEGEILRRMGCCGDMIVRNRYMVACCFVEVSAC